jgi:ubiquinone biosynthesis protein COQ9
MNTRNQDIQDKIIEAALEDVAFDGWKWSVIEAAAVKAGYGEDMAMAVFPEKLSNVLAHFSDLADRQMLDALKDITPDDLRIRDRIKQGVMARLMALNPYKESVRAASVYWLVPTRKIQAAKQVWKTADVIWTWAGDEAEDYNHYTKRLLLSGVITATTVAWLNDTSEDHQDTEAFLDRRINNVLKIGGAAGKFMGPILGRFSFLNKKKTGA